MKLSGADRALLPSCTRRSDVCRKRRERRTKTTSKSSEHQQENKRERERERNSYYRDHCNSLLVGTLESAESFTPAKLHMSPRASFTPVT